MDVYWGLESESDYRITKGTGWLEILGCGMVDPEVFKSVDYDSENGQVLHLVLELKEWRCCFMELMILDRFIKVMLDFLRQFK